MRSFPKRCSKSIQKAYKAFLGLKPPPDRPSGAKLGIVSEDGLYREMGR